MNLIIPGRVVPKARPRVNKHTGQIYTDPPYRDWLDMASATVAYTLRKPMMDGPLMVRCAFSPDQIEVEIMSCSPVEWTGRRPDLDNATGAIYDSLQQGGAIGNDRLIVRGEEWFV